MKKTLILSVALILLACTGTAHADVLASFDLAAKIQEKYKTVQSFKAAVTQTLTHAESQTAEQRFGTMLFQKPRLVRIETALAKGSNAAGQDRSSIVISRDAIWMYVPEEKVAYKYATSMLKDVLPSMLVLTGQANLLENFSIDGQTQEGGLARLVLYPKEPVTQLVKAVIWVEPKTGILRRVQVIDFYENINDVRFDDIQFNMRIPDTSFAFAPPPGVDVEDHTKK